MRLAGWTQTWVAGVGVIVGSSAGCGGGSPAAVTPPAAPAMVTGESAQDDWRYRVRVAEDLRALAVTVCFPRGAPRRLYASSRGAPGALRRAALRRAGGGSEPLAVDGRSLWLRGAAPGDCVDYSVDVGRGGQWWSSRAAPGARVLTTSRWLWRPSPRRPGATGTIHFELAKDQQVAVPWREVGPQTFRFSESAFVFLGHSVFGQFRRERVSVPNGVFDVAVMEGLASLESSDLQRWLGKVAQSSASIFGHFPVPRTLVVLVPVAAGSGAIAFGQVGRGGGPSVMLLVRSGASVEELLDSWVAPHEFSHLAMPFVEREDAWLSEGVATYYQEVVRARVGLQTPLKAWQALHAGFRSGRRSGTGRTLGQESQEMYRTRAFRRVYWGGTAIALLYDVALRRRGGEVGSLDQALGALHRCCGHREETWSARQAVRRLDALAGAPVFGPLARRHLAATEFPDLDAVYAFLGLAADGERNLRFIEAPGSHIRDAIMATSSTTEQVEEVVAGAPGRAGSCCSN